MKTKTKTSKSAFKGQKTSVKFDEEFAKKLNIVCTHHGIDKSKVFRALVELEFDRIEKFRELFEKKRKNS